MIDKLWSHHRLRRPSPPPICPDLRSSAVAGREQTPWRPVPHANSATTDGATAPINARISIVVPVYNDPQGLQECVSALASACGPDTEIVVVDDASTDATPSVAARMGVRVLRLAENRGPSAARNHGALHVQGDVLFFVDADVVIAPDAFRRVGEVLTQHPEISAVFGSYDARPRAGGLVSQYRNLLHHFVHQTGSAEASTFWAGCGAIRRAAFEAVGGFDETRRFLEDIELGYRLREAGYRIRLDKVLQGTHLKRWTLRSVIRTDTVGRAVPWARLLREHKVPNDLNIEPAQRVSVALVLLAGLAVLPSVFRVEFLGLSGAALLSVVVLNRDLYAFFYRQRGLGFAAATVPLHLLQYFCSGLSYAYVWAEFHLRRRWKFGWRREGRA
jgi:GT2 family glycosyltransferase